jgi:hypothetical protein
MAELKSYLKPENSLIMGAAVIGLVIANYNLHNGTAAQASASDAWQPQLVTSNKKAGWTSLAAVAGIALISRDANVFILGCSAVIAMHSSYLHSIATSPQLNQVVAPASAAAAAYAPSVSGT